MNILKNDVIHYHQKLNDDVVNEIHNTFKGRCNWFYNEKTVDFDYDNSKSNLKDSQQFTHTIKVEDTDVVPSIATNDNTQFSHLWNEVQPILSNMASVIGVEQLYVKRMKANLLIPQPNFTRGDFHPPHWDTVYDNCFSIVYYVNDSDGPTYIFDRFWPDNPKGMKILKEVSPKKGDFVLFNSKRWHASSNPIINSNRIVLNIVVRLDK